MCIYGDYENIFFTLECLKCATTVLKNMTQTGKIIQTAMLLQLTHGWNLAQILTPPMVPQHHLKWFFIQSQEKALHSADIA